MVHTKSKDRQHRRSTDSKGSGDPRNSSSFLQYSESNKTEKLREKQRKHDDKRFRRRRKYLKRQNAQEFDDIET